MHHLLPYSDSCLYWCLAYIREGTSDLRIYVAVTSPYHRDRGVTGWYQSLGSYFLSTSRWQINGKAICNWNAWVLVIQSNYKCRVIFLFLLIHSLYPEPFNLLPSSFFLSPFQPTQIWKDGEHAMVLVPLKMDPTETVMVWWGYFKRWCRVNNSRQSFYVKDYWLHPENRGQATC